MSSSSTSLSRQPAAVRTFTEFLARHRAKEGDPVTHARVPQTVSCTLRPVITPGRYSVPEASLPELYRMVYALTARENWPHACLSTQQLPGVPAGMFVDVDLVFSAETTLARVVQEEHLCALVHAYVSELFRALVIPSTARFDVIVLQKPGPNVCADAAVPRNKDGVHIVFDLNVDQRTQEQIRRAMVARMPELWPEIGELCTTPWDKVLDEAVTSRTAGWMMYGCTKPHGQLYDVTQYYTIAAVSGAPDEFVMTTRSPYEFDIEENMHVLCARHTRTRPTFPPRSPAPSPRASSPPPPLPRSPPSSSASSASSSSSSAGGGWAGIDAGASVASAAAAAASVPPSRPGKRRSARQPSSAAADPPARRQRTEGGGMSAAAAALLAAPHPAASAPGTGDMPEMTAEQREWAERHYHHDPGAISCGEELDCAVAVMLEDLLRTASQTAIDAHTYAQMLPEAYYCPGSHAQNLKVAYALHHTDPRLFLSWIKLRSKAEDFLFSDIDEKHRDWQQIAPRADDKKAVTYRSLMFWAKQDNPAEYTKYSQSTVEFHIDHCIFSPTDFDIAKVMHAMMNDTLVCYPRDGANKSVAWMRFTGHQWKAIDERTVSRMISDALAPRLDKTLTRLMAELRPLPEGHADANMYRIRIDSLAAIINRCLNSPSKASIIKAVSELCFDQEFPALADANPYLLGMTNGVVDFDAREVRAGKPGDYVTKCTSTLYLPDWESNPKYAAAREGYTTLLSQLFETEDKREFILDYLAHTLIGVKSEQIYLMLFGSGSNGKSLITNFMRMCLGDYFKVVPVSLFTGERVGSGQANSDVAMLRAIRLAAMQEPQAGAVLNDGVMKEITSCDLPIACRELFQAASSFIPQMSFMMSTNIEPTYKTQDDGAWRRTMRMDMNGKFVAAEDMSLVRTRTDRVFPMDKFITRKITQWTNVFLSMLIHRAFRTGGTIRPCAAVIETTRLYRRSQDCIGAFIADEVVQETVLFRGRSAEAIEELQRSRPRVQCGTLYATFSVWFDKYYKGNVRPGAKAVSERFISSFGAPGEDKTWPDLYYARDAAGHPPSVPSAPSAPSASSSSSFSLAAPDASFLPR